MLFLLQKLKIINNTILKSVLKNIIFKLLYRLNFMGANIRIILSKLKTITQKPISKIVSANLVNGMRNSYIRITRADFI